RCARPGGGLRAIRGRWRRAPPFAEWQEVIRGVGALAAIKASRGGCREGSEQVSGRTIRRFSVARAPGHAVSLAEHGRQGRIEMQELFVVWLAPLPSFGETKKPAIHTVIEGPEDPVEALLDGEEIAAIPRGPID